MITIPINTSEHFVSRIIWGQRIACRNGHPLTTVNIYTDPTGREHCRACRSEASRRARIRRRILEPSRRFIVELTWSDRPAPDR